MSKATDFKATAHSGPLEFYKWQSNKWVVASLYPDGLNATAASEVLELSKSAGDFNSRNTSLLIAATGTTEAHATWASALKEVRGKALTFPLITDTKGDAAAVSTTLGGIAGCSSLLIIDPEHTVRATLHLPSSVGRSISEVIRLLDAIQLAAKHEAVSTPAGWTPGTDVLVASAEAAATPASGPAATLGLHTGPAPQALSKKQLKKAARGKNVDVDKSAKKAALKEAVAKKAGDPSKAKAKKPKSNKPPAPNHKTFKNPTPVGEKKDMTTEMAEAYYPTVVEASWYDWWDKQGFFKATANTEKKKTFTIVIPPPNVTGSLHIGHALTNSVEDVLVRFYRMKGYETLWVPGTDHAGIATQTVVERKIAPTTRHDLGREKFVEKVWEWKAEYGSRITTQLKRLGSSLDWDREAFTMDDKLSRAVKEAFVRMHDDGLIYRYNRLVNWCVHLKTAISDLEVDHVDIKGPTQVKVPGYENKITMGKIIEFAYPVEGGGEIVVATTRLETMLADTAVAVHPDDPRYSAMQGKFVIHPFNQRKIPIITDATLVDMNFGTGAVKVTPAHDPNDFETGKRHKLPFIDLFTEDGLINDVGGEQFKGMKRFDARFAVLKALKELKLFRGEKPHEMRLGFCSRSKDIIEPMIKPQWFCDCKSMAKAATDAVRNGELEIVPPEFDKTWFGWLDNIHDWCISRQLWWGHRIPAYQVHINGKPAPTASDTEHWVSGRSEEEAAAKAEKKFGIKAGEYKLVQDEDVLDTWFSSGLFPFSVMGWPEETDDFKSFYPTSVLETGHDILFFWVARMVMMGIHLTGKVPFKKVYLHAMIRDAHGRKMSKSLGNVVDPVDVINGISQEELLAGLASGNLPPAEVERASKGMKEDFPSGIPECGTDALRFGLAAYTSQARDINLNIRRIESYRQFGNKLWNATRFALLHLNGFKPTDTRTSPNASGWDKWILSRLTVAATEADKGIDKFDLSSATSAVYSWWLYEVCDVYLEVLKPIMAGSDADAKLAAQTTLYTCLDEGLKMLHPFMPYVTEELWQRLPRRPSEISTPSIMITAFPEPTDRDEGLEADVTTVMRVVRAGRSLKAAYNEKELRTPNLTIVAKSDSMKKTFTAGALGAIQTLTRASELKVSDTAPSGCAVEVINSDLEVHMLIKGFIDISKEIGNIEGRLAKVTDNLTRTQKTFANLDPTKVPEDKKDAMQARIADLTKEKEIFERAIADLKSL